MKIAIIDFETEPIELRPKYPPKPVGVSVQRPFDRKPKYYAWGHADKDGNLLDNNCEWKDGKRALEECWESDWWLLFHHAKFDVDVAETHMEMKELYWDRIHDTEYLLFLYDPHAPDLKLKPSAHRILGMPPTEQQNVRQWLIDHGVVTKNDEKWGKYICRAPGKLVGPYADGDVIRTGKIFKKIYPIICERGMKRAYDRERRLMRVLLPNEREGIRADVARMERDLKVYEGALEKADDYLRKRLHAPGLNLNQDKDVGEVLAREKVVTDWVWTKGSKDGKRKPQRSVAKGVLTLDKFHDPKIAAVWGYRNRLTTCLGLFMRPWLNLADANNMVHPNWNQVRQAGERKGPKGTRTGRPSMEEPNFLNVSKDFEGKDDGYKHPKCIALPPLPFMRQYILPDKGQVWGHRDYNQQELRMLAHFENGGLRDHYNSDPRFDIHTEVQNGFIKLANLSLTRPSIKIVNFSDLYGKGEANLAASLHVDIATIKLIKKTKAAMMPGVAELVKGIQWRGKMKEPIRTWGGREYFVEEPMFVKKFGRLMTFEYKLTNYLIQGSSADVTKEAIIFFDEHPQRESRFLVTVYDEINASMPKSKRGLQHQMHVLKECMMAVCHEEYYGPSRVDVPMVSDGKTGINWAEISKYKEAEDLVTEFHLDGDWVHSIPEEGVAAFA